MTSLCCSPTGLNFYCCICYRCHEFLVVHLRAVCLGETWLLTQLCRLLACHCISAGSSDAHTELGGADALDRGLRRDLEIKTIAAALRGGSCHRKATAAVMLVRSSSSRTIMMMRSETKFTEIAPTLTRMVSCNIHRGGDRCFPLLKLTSLTR